MFAFDDDPLVKPEKRLKAYIRKRFNGCCVYCGNRFDLLTCDHIVPVSKGGHTSVTNLAPACCRCNHQKGDRDLTEWWRRQRFWDEGRYAIVRGWLAGQNSACDKS